MVSIIKKIIIKSHWEIKIYNCYQFCFADHRIQLEIENNITTAKEFYRTFSTIIHEIFCTFG